MNYDLILVFKSRLALRFQKDWDESCKSSLWDVDVKGGDFLLLHQGKAAGWAACSRPTVDL